MGRNLFLPKLSFSHRYFAASRLRVSRNPVQSREGDNSKMKILYICACIHRYMASKTNVIERPLKKEKIDLSEYFGALKDSPLLDKIEADSKKIRENARSRV
jgi:hypothetical protein